MGEKRRSVESSSSSLVYSEDGEKTDIPGGYQSVKESLAQIALAVNPKSKHQSRILIINMVVLIVVIIVLGALALDAKVLLDDLNNKMTTVVDDTEVLNDIMETELGAMIKEGDRVCHNSFLMCTVMAYLGSVPGMSGILGLDFTLKNNTENPCCPVGGSCYELFNQTRIDWQALNGAQ